MKKLRRSQRDEFLKARMEYLATLKDEGASEEQMFEAVGVSDTQQIRFLLETLQEIDSGKWHYDGSVLRLTPKEKS